MILGFLIRHLHAKRTEEALWSWQQTCEQQEWELATLRGILDKAQLSVDTFSRTPTEGHVQDVIGLAESLRRYREMAHGARNLDGTNTWTPHDDPRGIGQ